MKKFARILLALTLCITMLMPMACKKDKGNSSSNPGSTGSDTPPEKVYTYDPESRPVVFAIGALDNNFNPFFATTANDVSVAGMTQLSMITADKEGNPAYGENEACVVLDLKQTMYDADGSVTTTGDPEGRTEYEFVIKNGIKFSDGVDLTIKDVLFNLYVYLDPAYTGSSTIYSTDIKGLKAYRAQDPEMSDDSSTNTDNGFYAAAQQRIINLVNYWDEGIEPVDKEQLDKDIATVKDLFKKEVTSDWNNCAGTLESYEKEYNFTEDWQVYYLNEGIISILTEKNANGAVVLRKDANGKYITTIDDDPKTPENEAENFANHPAIMQNAVEENLSKYMSQYNCDEQTARGYIYRDVAIETVYNNYTSSNSNLIQVVSYWATAGEALEKFAGEERTKYFNEKLAAGKLPVESISGITTYKTDNFHGKNLGAEHDVLKVVINGIDPKAIWNFGFTVSPMHYYSNAEQTALAHKGEGFGVKFGDQDFFENVLSNEEKNGLPMGAGVYKASSSDGSATNRAKFYENGVVYYERNTYFETVGKGIHNAKIKYFNYKVTGDNNILNSLISQNIDYGEPSATTYNINQVSKVDHLGYQKYLTNGYGYVGINPKYVPDIEVRRAIMKGMNTALIIKNYYTAELASIIYRPMSSESWAYPDGCTEYYTYVGADGESGIKEIQQLLTDGGWKQGTEKNERGVNIWVKDGKKLKYTFTIAGETEDHPAYSMFIDAESFLEECGFDIIVKTDIQALKKLATGKLEVWAAAWSSAIDPDMYQVYHKDSNATSVKNWNRDEIVYGNDENFAYEKQIVNDLATVIMEARQTLNTDERKEKYAEALDLVMEFAVELPTYQRSDLVVYNTKVIDTNSLNLDSPNANQGVVHRLWELDFN